MTGFPEIWLPVVGYEGRYEVSDLGRVRSLRYKHGARPAPFMLALHTHKGYPRVTLTAQGSETIYRVSELVLTAFRGPCPDGMEASHVDGTRANNRLCNLVWETHADNCARRCGHGTDSAGERNPNAKLTVAAVRAIRRARRGGALLAALGRRYGVTKQAISLICSNKNWKEG